MIIRGFQHLGPLEKLVITYIATLHLGSFLVINLKVQDLLNLTEVVPQPLLNPYNFPQWDPQGIHSNHRQAY